jgi:hypothetical protein
MNDGWGIVLAFFAGCLGMGAIRMIERVWGKRRPPRDTAELLNRIADVAHPLIEARLTCAWHEAELARQIDSLPPVFEDQVMLAAQLGQAIEQSVMREVQRQGIPIVRLSEQREAGYFGWMSKWLRRASDEIPEKPVIVVPGDPQLPPHTSVTVPPSRPLTIVPPPPKVPSSEPLMIFRPGVGWIPRKG